MACTFTELREKLLASSRAGIVKSKSLYGLQAPVPHCSHPVLSLHLRQRLGKSRVGIGWGEEEPPGA